MATFRAFARTFGTPNKLVVVLRGDDPEALESAVDDAAARLRAVPGVRGVLARLPYDAEALARLGRDPYLV